MAYGKILGQLIASRDDNRVPMEPSQFGSYIVRTFCGNYNGKDDAVSLSLLKSAAGAADLRPEPGTR
jgi:hypothetical protein